MANTHTVTKSTPRKALKTAAAKAAESHLPDTETSRKLTIFTAKDHEDAIQAAIDSGNTNIYLGWSEAKRRYSANTDFLNALKDLYLLPVLESGRRSIIVPSVCIDLILSRAVELHQDPIDWHPAKIVEDIKSEIREQIIAEETARLTALLNS